MERREERGEKTAASRNNLSRYGPVKERQGKGKRRTHTLDGAVEDVVQSRFVESIVPALERRSRGDLIGVNSDAGLEREGCFDLAHDPDRVCHELRDVHVQQIRVRGVVLLIDAKKNQKGRIRRKRKKRMTLQSTTNNDANDKDNDCDQAVLHEYPHNLLAPALESMASARAVFGVRHLG